MPFYLSDTLVNSSFERVVKWCVTVCIDECRSIKLPIPYVYNNVFLCICSVSPLFLFTYSFLLEKYPNNFNSKLYRITLENISRLLILFRLPQCTWVIPQSYLEYPSFIWAYIVSTESSTEISRSHTDIVMYFWARSLILWVCACISYQWKSLISDGHSEVLRMPHLSRKTITPKGIFISWRVSDSFCHWEEQ